MSKLLPWTELGFNILLLPPISRGAHLDGPLLHAQRLVELWQLDSNDDIPLAQAFRLLDVETIAGAILRTLVAADDYPSDHGAVSRSPHSLDACRSRRHGVGNQPKRTLPLP